ncbi:MAG: hypothetical protein V3W18_00745 [candidate division Zixibacteria bacterium]
MGKNFGELAKKAEKAVKGIKDKELRKEAFRIFLLQLMAGGGVSFSEGTGLAPKRGRKKRGPGRPPLKKTAKKAKKPAKRPGRAGGGVVTTGLNKLLTGGYFRANRDATTVFNEFRKRRIDIEPSQLRMELLRFARSGKLKRKIKMKGRKVTYLYRR